MQHERENGAWVAWRKALAFREDARRTAMSKDEFSPQEQEKFELDSAGITGESNPETYRLEPRGYDEQSKEPVDYREEDPRFA